MSYPHFRFYKRKDILSLTRLRHFETRLGECVQTINDATLYESLLQCPASFIVVSKPVGHTRKHRGFDIQSNGYENIS